MTFSTYRDRLTLYQSHELPLAGCTTQTVRVLIALIRLKDRQLTATVRDVAAAIGLGVSATYYQLCRLRECGLVDWEPGSAGAGTLRPLVRVVPFGVRKET